MRSLIIPLVLLLIMFLMSTTRLSAQDNQEKVKQKEIRQKEQQKKIEEKKKQQKELDSISEQAEASYEDELKQLFEEQKRAQEEVSRANRETQRISREYDRKVYSSRPALLNFYDQTEQLFTGSGDNATFTISKHIKNTNTFTSDFEYEVPEKVVSIFFDFNGELETGSLKITIVKPNGKVFQVLNVTPVADVNWNKKYKIKEGESDEYSGTWKVTISTKDAKGYYELRVNSY